MCDQERAGKEGKKRIFFQVESLSDLEENAEL